MNTENIEFMRMAKASLNGKWGVAAGTTVIYLIITGSLGFVPFFGPVGTLIIGGPFTLGYTIFTLSIARNQDTRLEMIFDGFKNFGVALATYLLMLLFVFLWSLLLIVPGIIAALSFSMAFFILADKKEIGAFEALEQSKKMMYGYKWKFFCLGLRFLGWIFLCLLTAGIGFFWLVPYMQVSFAKFYEELKANEATTATAETVAETI